MSFLRTGCLVILLFFLSTSCSASPFASLTPTASSTITLTNTPAFTLTPTITPTSTATITPTSTATHTHTPTATVTETPQPLGQFNSKILRPGVEPVAYLTDTCEYLKLRWEDDKSQPGTVVVPVMFHSIVQEPSKVTDPKDITVGEFQSFVYYAESLGFETITTQELLGFLLYNDPIPMRSMIIIVDDRRPGLISEHFMPVLEVNDWTVTAAYIADPNGMDWAWDWMERMNATGRLDVQSHGYSGQVYIVPETPLEDIQSEIWDSTAVLEEHFGKRPIAFIWPGGNFTPLSVQVAREGGYQLGFTAYSRGPLLFNWIPQGEEERLVNDPLMLLPRAWSNSVNYNLDEALRLSEQAIEFVETNAQAEQEYLSKYCGD
jgi:peptidoglycan/xylan/chitin deacetylase (PgdA/CDA1 family)